MTVLRHVLHCSRKTRGKKTLRYKKMPQVTNCSDILFHKGVLKNMLKDPKYGRFLLYLHVFSGRCSNQDLAEENKAATRNVPFHIGLSFSATTF